MCPNSMMFLFRTQGDTCVKLTLALVASQEKLHTRFRFSVFCHDDDGNDDDYDDDDDNEKPHILS